MVFLFHILLFAVLLYFLASTIYLVVFALAGKLRKAPPVITAIVKRKISIVIPAYREDSIIVNTVSSALAHSYPDGSFNVLVVADQLQPETVAALRTAGAEVILADFERSGKGRSLNLSLSCVDTSKEDIILILDADNILAAGALDKINSAFESGCEALQMHRVAKNTETPVALLDAISEEINLNIFRRGAFNLGLSAAPMGSGMAFSGPVFEGIFSQAETIASANEDREVENYLISKKIRMHFLDDAWVYDEKVSNTAILKNQRIRWMEAQLRQVHYFFNNWGRGRSSQFYHSLFQSLLLPRVFFLALSGIIFLVLTIGWIIGESLLFPAGAIWPGLVATYWFVLIVSIPRRFFTLRTLKAVFSLPVIILTMIGALFQLKKRRKEFLHTSKSFVARD